MTRVRLPNRRHSEYTSLAPPATMGIGCKICRSTETDVRDTRPKENYIRRRRRCKNCGHLFTTRESEAPVLDLRGLILEAHKLVLDAQSAAVKIKEALEAHDLLPPMHENGDDRDS